MYFLLLEPRVSADNILCPGTLSEMNRPASCLLCLFVLVFLGMGTKLAAADDRPPNIVYIMLDEWGYYEQSDMGHPILQTPNIDRMAKEGMRFTQILAGGNVCAPTRCSLMTGASHGAHFNQGKSRGQRASYR